MAAKKRSTTKKKQPTKKQQAQQQAQKEKLVLILSGVLFLVFGLISLVKLGFLGTFLANILRLIGGNSYPVLSIVLMLYGGFLAVKNTQAHLIWTRRLTGSLVLYSALVLFLQARLFGSLQSGKPNILHTTWETLLIDLKTNQLSQNVGGGMFGAILYQGTYFLLSQVGSYVISLFLALFGIYLISQWSTEELLEKLHHLKELFSKMVAVDPQTRQQKEAKKQAKRQAKEQELAMKKAEIIAEMEAEKQNVKANVKPAKQSEKSTLSAAAQEVIAQEELAEDPVQVEVEQPTFVPINGFQQASLFETPPAVAQTPVDPVSETDDGVEFKDAQNLEDESYELPPTDLLAPAKPTDQSGEYKKIEQNIGVLEQTFKSFGVDAKVVKASLGPSVTKFEIQPAVGVKVSKIVSLTDDIALALAAKDVRMEAPIPGKSLIGIEVPNEAVSMVSFREVVEAQPAHEDKLLEVPLGRDISGKVQTADLTKMPHLLVAGSTGSGKSVAINGIITSILMQAKPHQVKLMMVDPKMVELNMYNGIPHLLTPVVTNPRKAAQALQKVVKEMEERYEKFAATGVRNITGYNEMIEAHNLQTEDKQPILPFIVVIVDELADLMMVASNEVEDAIIRLAQMARAAGIHMILATQRPSVDVITGIIKANVPSRIAFAVSSGTDSRTIIDSNGAEKLLGRGDMLYLPMGENKPIRVQGAFISDQDVEAIVEFVTAQQGANYEEKMMVSDEEAETGASSEPQDELFDQAKELVVEMQTASVSLLQRRFRIGYNRAARLVDELEAHGIVGPSEGSKPRKVLLETLEIPTPNEQLFEPPADFPPRREE